MKCSLGISNFLEESSSLSHSVGFLCFSALITEEGLISPCCYFRPQQICASLLSAPQHSCRPLLTGASTGDPQTVKGRSGFVSWIRCSFPGSWYAQGSVVPSKSLFPQSCGSSVIRSCWPSKSDSLGILSPFAVSHVGKSFVEPSSFLNSVRTSLV